MIRVIIFVMCFFLVSCDKQSKKERDANRAESLSNRVLCIDNVEYIVSYKKMTVKFKPDSTVSTCK